MTRLKILPVLMHGSETLALKKAEKDVLERIDTRMLRWMMGIKRIEKIRNEEIRARARVPNINEKREKQDVQFWQVMLLFVQSTNGCILCYPIEMQTVYQTINTCSYPLYSYIVK